MRTMEWDYPAAGEQNRPTGCPSPPSGIPQMRRLVERMQNPQSTRVVACPEEEAGSPHRKKAKPPGCLHHPPAGAAPQSPDDNRETIKIRKG
jgi:hypothetical protein